MMAPGSSAPARSWRPHSSSLCLSASAAQGVYLGRLRAPRDEQIVRLTMLIEGARNLSLCLSFGRRWGRKSMGTTSAEDGPEALGSEVLAPDSASLSPAKADSLCRASWDPALSPGVTKSPPSHAPTCQQNLPGSRGFLPRLLQNYQDQTLISQGCVFESWAFCTLEIKAQLPDCEHPSASDPTALPPPSLGSPRRAKLGPDPTAIEPRVITAGEQSQLNATALLPGAVSAGGFLPS